MKKKFSLVFAAILSLALVLSACGQGSQNQASSDKTEGGKTYKFKLAHIAQASHGWNKTSEKFSEELKTRSNGRMTVDLFPAGQLGTEKDEVQQLETGTLDFALLTNAYLSTRSEAFNAWFMPFMFNDLEKASAARNTEPAKKILAELSKQGIVALDISFIGNRHILMKGNSITKPEDLKGKKIRIIGSPAIQDFWKAVGAGPTPMPLSEVYIALQTGVIDGIDIDLDALMTEKYYEIAKNLTLTNHMTFAGVIVMSKAKYDALSPEDQKIVTEAIKAAVDWGTKEAIAGESKYLEELKAKGVTVTQLANADAFKAVRDEINAKYSSNPLIKEFIQANQK